MLEEHQNLPANIQSFITDFDEKLSDEEFGSQRYAYRILFIKKQQTAKDRQTKLSSLLIVIPLWQRQSIKNMLL